MIINEAGHFWLSESKEDVAPVPGQLTIDENGKIELELHQTFPSRVGDEAVFGIQKLENDIYITGILKKSGRYVILKNLRTNGAFIGDISYENFSAGTCLASDIEIDTCQFEGVIIPLRGLNNWINSGEFEFKRTTDVHSVLNMRTEKNKTWKLPDGQLKLINDLKGKAPNRSTVKVEVEITSHFNYEFNEKKETLEIFDICKKLEDLLLILINENTSIGWPSIIWTDKGKKYSAECYFKRKRITENSLKWDSITLPLPRISNRFGEIVTTWFEKRKTLGPGINLYLSILKNKSTYAENSFVNMIWGLESLDRRNDFISDNETDKKLNEKIKRISEIIKENQILDSNDRRWLMNALKRDNERSLAERLYDTISRIELNLNPEKLRTFCVTCANLRNDLSHHGGERTIGEYDNFISQLIPHMRALSTLYLAVILDILKIETEEIVRILFTDPGSYAHIDALSTVGLTPDISPFSISNMQ